MKIISTLIGAYTITEKNIRQLERILEFYSKYRQPTFQQYLMIKRIINIKTQCISDRRLRYAFFVKIIKKIE